MTPFEALADSSRGLPPKATTQSWRFVQIPSNQESQVMDLDLRPYHHVNYGTFFWLALSDGDYLKLNKSRIPFVLNPQAGKVRVGGFSFDPLGEGEPGLPADMKAPEDAPGFRWVQFIGPTKDLWLRHLEATGLLVLQYYPHHAFLVWDAHGRSNDLAALNSVRWHGPFHPAYKIHPGLLDRNGLIENVDIHFYAADDPRAIVSIIEGLATSVLSWFPSQADKRFYDAIVQVDASHLKDIARLSHVLWIGYMSPRPGLDDEVSDQIIAGNHSTGIPYPGYHSWLTSKGIDGTGVIFAHVDTGCDTNNSATAHQDIMGRIAAFVDYTGGSYPTDVDGHGTHTAGIIAGNATLGIADPDGFYYGLGVGPNVQLVVQNALLSPSWPPLGGWQQLSKDSVTRNAIGSSNSWYTGASGPQGYSSACATHDRMVRDADFDTMNQAEPLIMVFSAGNAGPSPSTITEPKEAKNLIVVGASENYRPANPLGSGCGASSNIDRVVSFSSRGSCLDGRIAPHIVAPGSDVASLRTSTGDYGGCLKVIMGRPYVYGSGTSMACPHVSGAVALITQWWRTVNGNANPSPAMAKALLVNGATDMETPDIPNMNEGWGRMNLDNVISPTVPSFYLDQTTVLGHTGEVFTLQVSVPDPGRPLKITIAWSDAPGAPGANPALVNNLDLVVETAGNTYRGNVFLNGWSTTGGTPDSLNNLENVYVQSPGSIAVITVLATNISGDGIPLSGDFTDQDFALVCSNCRASYTVQFIPGPNGSLSGNPTQTVDYGQDTTPVQALPDIGYFFHHWSGDPIGTENPLTLTHVTKDMTLTASFDLIANASVKNEQLLNYYSAIQASLNDANLGDAQTIQCLSGGFGEGPVTFSRDLAITLAGGYESGFVNQTGVTTLVGSLTISLGTLTLENFSVR